ncbi:MAG TPA: DUF2460 domain-containing protein [Azospirillaceae bacterium]|nr:DUF2460 domain-containing protein [Azospirillaceae bacterium]
MTSFHEVQFPSDVSRGASGGPGYSTTVVVTVSGHEKRNVNWAQARGKWNVAHGLKTRDQVAGLIAFFRARKGKAYGFRFKDWTDYQGAGQPLGVGDGATKSFQLTKIYASGGVVEARVIAKPVAGTVVVYKNGVAAAGWTVDAAVGVVTFAVAPVSGAVLTADFEFDVPARFDTDQMDITAETYDLARWAQIPVVELRL